MPCFEKLVITKQGLEAMSNEAYKEERNQKMDAIAQKVEQAIEGERFVLYSVYKYDVNGIIIDNLDEVAIVKCTLPTPF